jgi:hypothetical protein
MFLTIVLHLKICHLINFSCYSLAGLACMFTTSILLQILVNYAHLSIAHPGVVWHFACQPYLLVR